MFARWQNPSGQRSRPEEASERCARGTGLGPPAKGSRLCRDGHQVYSISPDHIDWKDKDKIGKVIAEELPAKVSTDKAYQNAMKNSDKQNARIEHDRALERAVIELLSDHTELFKQFSDNASFKKWLSETIFSATYSQ